MTPDELQLIADVLAWTCGYDCLCDDKVIGQRRDRIMAAAAECAAHLEKHCEDRA